MRSKLTRRFIGVMIGGLCLIGILNSAELPLADQEIGIIADQSDTHVRYAKACLDLAHVELQLVEQANKKYQRTFSRSEVEQKRANVRVAEKHLYVALKKAQGNPVEEPFFVSQAREQAELAKRRYQRALETRNRNLVYSELKLEKLRLEAEIAQLRLEMWSEPQNLLSLIDQLNWQVERLRQEISELQTRVDELSHL